MTRRPLAEVKMAEGERIRIYVGLVDMSEKM